MIPELDAWRDPYLRLLETAHIGHLGGLFSRYLSGAPPCTLQDKRMSSGKGERVTGHDLLLTQLALACIGLDAQGRLIRLPGPHPDGIPRFYSGQLDEGTVTFYHHDLPPAIRARLATLPLAQAREDHAAVCAILSRHAPCGSI